MNFKHGMVLAGVALTVAGCGGGSDPKAPSPPFVEFRVNGALFPTEVIVNRVHFEGRNSSDEFVWDPCDSDTFLNGDTVAASYPDFCVNEISTTTVNFTVQYFNSTYEDLKLDYSGQGFTISIHEYDDTQVDNLGTLVWTSDYFTQMAIERFNAAGASFEDFDPGLKTSVSLKPSHAYPDQDIGASLVSFFGDRNLIAGYESFDPAGLNQNPPDDLCDWNAVASDADPTKFNKVVCRTENLLPLPSADLGEELVYVARVEFNYNGWTDQPDDVVIRIRGPVE